jgi:hypothetical protein
MASSDLIPLILSALLPGVFNFILAGFLVWVYLQTSRRAALFLIAYYLFTPFERVLSSVLIYRNLEPQQIGIYAASQAVVFGTIYTGLMIWLLYSLVCWGRPKVDRSVDRSTETKTND